MASPIRRSTRVASRSRPNLRESSSPEPEPRQSKHRAFPLIQGLNRQTPESLVKKMFTMLEFLPPELFACGGVCDLDKLPQDSEIEVEYTISDQVTTWQKLKSGFWQDKEELGRFKRYAERIYRQNHGNDYFEAGRPQPALLIYQPEVNLINPEPWREYAEQLAYRAFEEFGIGPFEFTVTFSHVMFWEKGCIWTAPDRDSHKNNQVGTLMIILDGQHNGGGVSIHCGKRCFYHPESPPLRSGEQGPGDADPYWVAALRGGTSWDVSNLAWGGPRLGLIYHLYFKEKTKVKEARNNDNNEQEEDVEEVPVPYKFQLREYINHVKFHTQPMYADCMLSSRLQAEGRLEEQFKRWVEFYRDKEEGATPNPLIYVFDTIAYSGVIRDGEGGQEQEDLMETLRPRHKRVWDFLSKLPRPGKWEDAVGRTLKKSFSLTVRFACVERLPDADAVAGDGDDEWEEEEEDEDTRRWRFTINWTQGEKRDSREVEIEEEAETDPAGIMNLGRFRNMWGEREKRICIMMELDKIKPGQKQTPGRGRGGRCGQRQKTQTRTQKRQTGPNTQQNQTTSITATTKGQGKSEGNKNAGRGGGGGGGEKRRSIPGREFEARLADEEEPASD